MKRLTKTLALCAIIVLVIATIFTLSACKVTAESISVEIVGGGQKIELTQQNASVDTIISKINVYAQLSNETSEKITDFSVEGFDATKLDTVQTVTIRYGDLTATVSVEVKSPDPVEPQIVSISVSVEGGKVILQQANATAAAILGQITVTANLDNNTTKPISEGLTIENFDATKLDTVQTVTIKYGTLTATVSVEVESATPVEPQIVSIAVSFDGEKITLQQESATAAAILAKITVTATLDNDTTKPLTEGLTLEGFDATVLDTDQSVVVKYGTLTSEPITVVVESAPDVVVVTDITVTIDGDKVTMDKETASEQALRGLLTVSAVKSDSSSETITDYQVIGLDLSKVDEDQSVTIKYGDFTKTVTVLIEDNSEPDIYEVYVIVNGDTANKITLALNPDPDNESGDLVKEHFGDVTLAKDDTVVVKDSNGTVISKYETNCPFQGTANKDGVHKFYVKTWKSGWINIWVTEPKDEPEPTVTALTTNVDGTLVLYGVKANNLKAAITVTATWSIGEPSVVAAADYRVAGYDKELLDEVQNVTISYGGKTVQISVQVKAASVVEINATLVGDVEVIELIGVKATTENILNAIAVTATYNDGTTSKIELEQLSVNAETFNATMYGETQQVQICLGEINTNVPVKVTAATPASLELDTESVNAIGANEEEVVADIKDKLVVTVIMTDGTSAEITDYTVTLEDGFSFSDFDNEQSAAIAYGKLTATVAVHMIKQPKSISVDKDEISLLETISDNTAKITALKKAIVVTLTSTDDTTKTVTDYTVKLSALDETTYTQIATISYKGLEDTLTVKVNILPVPLISWNGGVARFMHADPDNANTYFLPGSVTLKRGQTVAITLAGKALAMPDNFNGTAELDGAYSFAVAVDGLTGTITATVPEYAATLKVGDEAQGEPVVNNGVYTWTVTLALDDEITVSDNKFGNIKINGKSQYPATRSGQYTIAVTPGDTSTTVDVTVPAYAVTLTVKRAGAVVSTVALTENVDTDKEDGRLAEYIVEGLTLQKGDKVTITDNEGNTLSTYENCQFKGTAPRNGDYKFYVKIYSDKNSIWVAEPAKVVTITVNGGTPVTLERHEENEDHEEYMVKGLALTADDAVVIRLDGDVKSNYKTGCKFNGTVYLTGDYDFYVCVDGSSEDGIWVNDWVQVFHERNGNITIVPTEKASSTDGRVKEQRKAEVGLLVGDEIVVRDIGGNAFAYENPGDFNGTATKNGIYTLYIKIGWERANDIIYTAYAAPSVTSITTNYDDETLVLYGEQANNLKAALTVTAHYNVGDDVVITNYTITGYEFTKLNEVQTVTIALSEEITVEISVKVMEATVTGIAATIIEGNTIELIGVKATAENILKAITVTATYNDGTTKTVQGAVKADSFNATEYGTTQQVVITFGEETATVAVKVIEATASSLQLSSQSVTVTGTTENEVVTAIKGKITVNVVMTDESVVENAAYSVALADDFDFAATTAQSATITCYGLPASISVTIISQPKNISADVTSITILETSATETARLAAVKAQLVITLTMTDNTTAAVTDYTVDFGDFSATVYTAQTLTISYEGVDSITVNVTILPVPKISVNGAAATFMTVDSENANRYLSGDVQLTRGQTVAITLAGQAVAFPANFNGTAELNGTYGFAVTVDGTTGTITATVPEYVATLKVGNEAQTPTVNADVYTWTVTLGIGDIVTITDNKFGSASINGQAQYEAPRSGQYTITATPGATATTVAVTQPAYAVTLTVTRDGEVANTVVMDLSNERPDGCKAQYVVTGLELNKNDEISIADNEGLAVETYSQWTSFRGTAPRNGSYDFYAKLFADASSNNIYVAVPAMVVELSVNGTTPVTIELDTVKNEYVIRKVALQANDKVTILVDGDAYTNWKSGIALTATNSTAEATATADGDYDFYIRIDGGNDEGIYVAASPIENGVTVTVGDGAPIALEFDGSSEYYIRNVTIRKDAQIVVKLDGEVYTNWKGISVFTVSDGTATAKADGNYDFYVKLEGESDPGIWAQYSGAFIVINNETIVALELNANGDEYFVTGVALQANDKVVVKVNGEDYTNWKNGIALDATKDTAEGTATTDGNYNFYVKVKNGDQGTWVAK